MNQNNEYPTKAELKKIREWNYLKPMELIEYIRPYWKKYGNMKITGKKVINLQMSTGGWSGNESIIEALNSINNLFFTLWWQKSERGGHYWFKIDLKINKKPTS